MTSTSTILKWAAAIVALVLTVSAISFVLWKQSTTGGHFLQSQTPECPHDWKVFQIADSTKRGSGWRAEFASGLSVSGKITSVPEFHDCQRLIVDGKYGPLSAVFASYRLDELINSLSALDKEGPYVDTASKLTQAFVVAEVFQQDGIDYPPLGMKLGFNCLNLYSIGGELEARMVPVGTDEASCATPFDPRSTAGTVLRVTINTFSGYKPADYPAVARWDRDPNTGTAYIGLKCNPVEWCEIGATTSSSSYLAGSSAGVPSSDRVQRIKGWYDEQYLAVVSTANADSLEVGPVKGRVFPDPNLSTYEWSNYTNRWVTTGHIALDAASPRYKKMLNLDATLPVVGGGLLNTIEMCYGTQSGCGIPSGYDFPSGTCGWWNSHWSQWNDRWWARITAASDKTVAYRCVIRRDHSDVDVDWVPGTARWRWMVRDETIWQECTRGCCEIEVGDT